MCISLCLMYLHSLRLPSYVHTRPHQPQPHSIYLLDRSYMYVNPGRKNFLLEMLHVVLRRNMIKTTSAASLRGRIPHGEDRGLNAHSTTHLCIGCLPGRIARTERKRRQRKKKRRQIPMSREVNVLTSSWNIIILGVGMGKGSNWRMREKPGQPPYV
ncbi:hypothetical protein F4779DRAFT_606193 [Xylariaceae sp. FL0662B]|nr:hypothetical protein F4779DRAFT_606193 [Xylariaceae sp. FL0662B]